jgi:multiple sugar transport system permease protein
MTGASAHTLLRIGASLAILVYTLSPIAYMLLTAFSRDPRLAAPGVSFEATLANFTAVMTTEHLHLLAYLRNSLLVASMSALLCLAVSAPAAYALTRIRFRRRSAVLMAVLAVSMFPQVSLIGYLFKLMSALGWINTYPALVFPYAAMALPLCLWILVSYFAQLPQDLDRAGLADGCTRLQVLVKVLLPVAAPGLFSTMLLAFIFAFNEFLFALMLTTDHRAGTLPVIMAMFEGLHGQVPWGEIMAAATIATLPVAVLAVVFQRRIVQGLTRGAVKG